jgi:predicted O-linked N-acetylglucosamine transferase (SPINDLY family)
LSSIDIFVSGDLTEPTGAQDHYTEKLVCMDGPMLSFDFGPGQAQAATQTYNRARFRMPEETVVYASGTNFFKITPELEELWIKILAASPGSRMLLYPFNPNWIKSYPTGPFLYRISSTCRRLGVDGSRLEIAPPMPTIADVRAMLGNVVDIYLDSFPHSGMTSLIDPLLAGVPTVVLEGNSQRSRQASGALRDLNIPELIASDQDAYVELAVRLGQDKSLRLGYAEKIRQAMARPPKFLDSKWCGNEMSRLLKKLVLQV